MIGKEGNSIPVSLHKAAHAHYCVNLRFLLSNMVWVEDFLHKMLGIRNILHF